MKKVIFKKIKLKIFNKKEMFHHYCGLKINKQKLSFSKKLIILDKSTFLFNYSNLYNTTVSYAR